MSRYHEEMKKETDMLNAGNAYLTGYEDAQINESPRYNHSNQRWYNEGYADGEADRERDDIRILHAKLMRLYKERNTKELATELGVREW